LYSAFVLRSQSGFWALITGAEPLNEPVFANHKNVFVGVVRLVLVGAAIIFNGRLRNKIRSKCAPAALDKPLTIKQMAYKWQEK